MTVHPFWKLIDTVPDFPKPGILFYDLTPLLAQPVQSLTEALIAAIDPVVLAQVEAFAAIEARGFVFASLLAQRLNRGLILLRKPGKLPPPVISQDYALEYGQDGLQVRPQAGQRVLLVDDVLATGGTLNAAARLCQAAGHQIEGAAVMLDLPALHGPLAYPLYRVLSA